MSRSNDARVGICMGSASDWATMEAASTVRDEFDVAHRVDVVSAHRMPEEMIEFPTGTFFVSTQHHRV